MTDTEGRHQGGNRPPPPPPKKIFWKPWMLAEKLFDKAVTIFFQEWQYSEVKYEAIYITWNLGLKNWGF